MEKLYSHVANSPVIISLLHNFCNILNSIIKSHLFSSYATNSTFNSIKIFS